MPTQQTSPAWFYIRNGKKVGPVSLEQLRGLTAAGHLLHKDMVLRQGTGKWAEAGTVAELFASPATQDTLGAPELLKPDFRGLPTLEGFAALPGSRTLSLGVDDSATQILPLPTIPGYEFLGELGRGGMGVVYKAEQSKLKRVVALKMVLGGLAGGAGHLERFRAEAEAIARLQHPNIVQVYEVGEQEGLPYFSLEFCGGGSLAHRLKGTPQPPREAARLVEILARAMQAAHQAHLIHRDLKPANILLAADGTPKITDFGLAKRLDDAQGMTQSGAVVGTPSYMAAEQALGKNKELGPAVDIYALGAILYEMLTGRPPFKGATAMDTLLQVATDEPVPPGRLQPKAGGDLETICLKCLEKEPSRRYPSAQALADDLGRFLRGEPIAARPAGWHERAWKWARRRPAVAALLGVCLLAFFAILGVAFYFTLELAAERNRALDEKANAEIERGKAKESEAEAKRQETVAKNNEAEAKRLEGVAKRAQQQAVTGEEEALRKLEQAKRSLLTAQIWRAAGIMDHDPFTALNILEDESACPSELRDFAWGYYRDQAQHWKPTDYNFKSHCLAVSADGKLAALTRFNGVSIWDLDKGQEKIFLRGMNQTPGCAAFSPKGDFVAAGGNNKKVYLWEVGSDKAPVELTGHTGGLQAMTFSHDGKWVASSSHNHYPNVKNSDERFQDGEIRLWNVTEGKLERVLQPKLGTGIQTVAFAPDDKTLAFGTTQYSDMRVLDVATGKKVDDATTGPGWVYRVAFSPDGQTLAWSTSSQLVNLRDLGAKKIRTLRGHQSDIFGLAWSPDGQTLATGSHDGKIILWKAATGKELLSLHQEKSSIEKIWFDPGGKALVVAHDKKTLHWNLTSKAAFATHGAKTGYGAVAISRSGKLFAAGDKEKNILLRNLATKTERFLKLPNSVAVALAFAPRPDGKEPTVLAIGTQTYDNQYKPLKYEGDCRLWDLDADKEIATLKGDDRPVFAVLFTPDGKKLFTGDGEGNLRLWDPVTHKEIKHLGKHNGPIYALALSPDGKTLASGGAGIKLWHVPELRFRQNVTGHFDAVKGLAFVDDGKFLVSTGHDRTLRLWNVAEGKPEAQFPAQAEQVYSLAVGADGQTIALGCQDRTVKLWDFRSQQLRAVLTGHTREVRCLAFSPQGDYLISGSTADTSWWVKGGELKIWKAMK